MGKKTQKLITASKYHRTLNGMVLVRLREAIGISQADFAEYCGWSQQYQAQLESPGETEIPTYSATLIAALLKEYK